MSEKENTSPCPDCESYHDHEPLCPFYVHDEEPSEPDVQPVE